MGRGRPRKHGKRTESGRLRRDNYPVPVYDHGTDRARARAERFGGHGMSALGRAYASGLLGDAQTAAIRYDVGKRFQRAVERFFEIGRVKCPLGQQTRLGATVVQITANPHEEAEWVWLNAMADALDAGGLRPWLDQLTHDLYADGGPIWLDRLLDGGRDPADQMVLKTAIAALDCIAPKETRQGIRAVRA